MQRSELECWLAKTLQPFRFTDYCPNGLQVEGTPEINKLITGVTASQALLDRAVSEGADAVLVHHGWFWRGEDSTIRGTRKQRIATALANDLNVFAYHLPLDAHVTYGNNAQLARVIGLEPELDTQGVPVTGGPKDLIWFGVPKKPVSLGEFVQSIAHALSRQPVFVGDLHGPCNRVAWCTGGAQGMFEAAIEAGVDAYITGEISEPNAHLARESGVAFIAAGHHATERYGVKALGEAIAKEFGVEVLFFDIDNPA
ncbi:MAG: Nif3-like dinuclear metal center hexameric protein [Burkholderiaceae bacterium]|nr:Nif3-like dinuclear metal center hexameric protein [Burkholderiaceae bacterium]MCD8517389.1 Nif3-like dinuclear metal center hexameric protein [Burkholderiaceae bacterium]MCD8536218.1 Nif3-like dinuclear metal center hexameric protein [Burkholderiaceae bacterium]MCD8564997.1 Nif3-like dinuclear metal center hexameric protein [Burkholderiaceae bacterium]